MFVCVYVCVCVCVCNDYMIANTLPGKKGVYVIEVLKYIILSPSLVLLFVSSCIRNAGGYTWALNTANFFNDVRNQDGTQQAVFMSWIPLVGGCFGAVFGGYVCFFIILQIFVFCFFF